MFGDQNKMPRRPFTSHPIETDVINLRIKGDSVLCKLKRWWYDLFLLSYEDTRSKNCYMSPYAIMMARAAQFQNERSSIHPFSKFRNFWDALTLFVLISRMIVFNFNSSIVHTPHIFFHYFLVFVDFILIMDIYVNLKTGYEIERARQVILNPHAIILNYLSTNAFFHAMAAIPYQTLMFIRLGKDICDPSAKANIFICTLKLISLTQIVKLFQASEYWTKDRGSFARTVSFMFLRIVVVGLVVTFQILAGVTASSTIIAINRGYIKPSSYHGYLVHFKYHYMAGKTEENLFLFMRFSRVCKTFFLFGFGIKPNSDILDQISTLLSYWSAFTFHFWAGIVLYNCVSRENSIDDRLYVAREQTFNLLRVRGLPDEIHTKVVKYYKYKNASLIILEKKNCLIKTLPRALTSEIKLSCYRDCVVKIPCFSKWAPNVIARIVELLQTEIYLADDLISSANNSYDGLIIIESGLLAVYSPEQQEESHVGDGGHFGESALVADRETANTVLAITDSTILVLDKILFRIMMMEYPALFCSLRMEFILATSTAATEEDTGVEETQSIRES